MVLFIIAWSVIVVLLASLLCRLYTSCKRQFGIAFFHPNCLDGGGGERVLWSIIAALCSKEPSRFPRSAVSIYTATVPGNDLVQKIQHQFQIDTKGIERWLKQGRLQFVQLRTTVLLDSGTYPRLTLLGQMMGSMFVGMEALVRFRPVVFIDTTGYPLLYPVANLVGGCRVNCYVHYPTIRSDMTKLVGETRKRQLANTGSPAIRVVIHLIAVLKIFYYCVLERISWVAAKCIDVVIVNSSWTDAHVKKSWRGVTTLVYPPCNYEVLRDRTTSAVDQHRNNTIISIGQFRPEKKHLEQLEIFELTLKNYKSTIPSDAKLILCGSTRNSLDRSRANKLRQAIQEKKLQSCVEVHENLPAEEIVKLLVTSKVGLHLMEDEHFGITPLELTVAGTIPVCHDSGGPRCDILKAFNGHKIGFLAKSREEFAAAVAKALSEFHSKELCMMRTHARTAVEQRFGSSRLFGAKCLQAWKVQT